MIQENIKHGLQTTSENWLKVNIGKRLTSLHLIWALLFFVAPVQAGSPITKIAAVYFNSDSSVVIETEDRNKLELVSNEAFGDSTQLIIENSKLNGDIPVLIQQGDLEMKLSRLKSEDRSWYKSKDQVEIVIKSLSGKTIDADFNTVLDGLAYQINLAPQAIQELVKEEVELELDAKPASDLFEISELEEDEIFSPVEETITEEPIKLSNNTAAHKLNASLSERGGLISFMQSKSIAEEFLETIDIDLTQDQAFVEDTFEKIDSSSLTHIGSELETRGKLEDAFRAYNEALEIDPKNLNARLGLARTSTNREERFQNFLAAIDNHALEEIGKEWHQQGLENNDAQAVSKSLVPFQLSVLKNPKSPEARFAYAEVLEDSGPDYYAQASKRYLEAAVLAKNQFISGDQAYRPLLRKSTESLIRTLTLIGDQNSAIKYCNSYLGLGFSNFLDGRSVASIMKEIKYNRNPFVES